MDEYSPKSRVVSGLKPLRRKFSSGSSELIEAVDQHISAHFGTPKQVIHEIVSEYVHIDLHHIAPTENRPYHTLVTSGMSEKPMRVESDVRERYKYKFAELVMSLPAEWPMPFDYEVWDDEPNFWPIGLITQLARYPHKFGTWLWSGHSMPFEEGLGSNTLMNGVVLLQPMLWNEEACTLLLNGQTVHFFGVFPLYEEEMNLKLRAGSDELERLFKKNGVTELLNLNRKNVITNRVPTTPN